VRATGDILLIAGYELGHQPLAVAWPAAFLEQLGYRPSVMDVSAEPFDVARAARAKLVAISVPMHTALRIGVAVAERVRAVNPGCHLTFYGLYASLNADYLLAHGADSVIGGEAEAPLGELARALESGHPVPMTVRTTAHAAGPHLERLAFPVPSRGQLRPLETYVRLERAGRRDPTGYVEASRGCRHLCRHCPIPPVYGGRFFAVPRDVVLADIRQQVAAGATHITFGDPDFLNGPTHALRLARALHAEMPRITFDFTAKIEHLIAQRARLPELAACGCIFIVSAAESLSDAVLGHLDKGHTRADVGRALEATRAAGIGFRPTWVAFTPWTTPADYGDLLDFVDGEGLIDSVEPIQYALRLLIPPGSLLITSAAMRPHLRDLDQATFSHRWDHPDARMDALQREVMARVTEGAERREDPAITFRHVRTLAAELAGIAMPQAAQAALAADRPRPPRLTEPWFC
jgi:radical SAM superfamily enzyme YgiQ (UPF0313 family)